MEQTGGRSIEWAAGLFEGEGCLTYNTTKDGWELKMQMTDPDCMWAFYEAIGCRGNLEGIRKAKNVPEHYRPTQMWRTCKRDLIFELVCELLPYMMSRRRERMIEFLNWYQEKTK